MDPKTIRTIVTVVVLAVLLIWFVVRTIRQKEKEQPPQDAPADTRPPEGVPPSPDDSPHLLTGNPSGATPDPSLPDNYMLKKPYYALSYHNAKGTPNWVSWRLQKSDLGPAPRSEFYPSPDLFAGFNGGPVPLANRSARWRTYHFRFASGPVSRRFRLTSLASSWSPPSGRIGRV